MSQIKVVHLNETYILGYINVFYEEPIEGEIYKAQLELRVKYVLYWIGIQT
jgi:hypothetical protein